MYTKRGIACRRSNAEAIDEQVLHWLPVGAMIAPQSANMTSPGFCCCPGYEETQHYFHSWVVGEVVEESAFDVQLSLKGRHGAYNGPCESEK